MGVATFVELITAAVLLLCCDGYFRGGELALVRRDNIAFPCSRSKRSNFIITIGAVGDKPAENLDVDRSVICGIHGRVYITRILTLLCRNLQGRDLLLRGVPFAKMRVALNTAITTLGLGHLDFNMHTSRHVGPSNDNYYHQFPLLDRQQRGRWRAPQSVLRYGKSAALRRQLARSTEKQVLDSERAKHTSIQPFV